MGATEDKADWVLPTLAFAQLGQLIVLVHGRVAPSAKDWALWLDHARQRAYRALLIDSLGGAPDARQRAQVANTTRADGLERPRTALLTDSTVQRHVVTAFGWLLGDRQPMRAFGPDDVEAALTWLHVAVPSALVRSTRERLSAALDGGAGMQAARQ